MPEPTAIPVVDIDALASADPVARRRVAGEIGRACRGIGFFVVVGHGTAANLVRDSFAASRALFALPDEVKRSLAVAPDGTGPRGYDGPLDLADCTAPRHDLKESFSLGLRRDGDEGQRVRPPVAGWRESVEACFDALLQLGRALHRAFALDLGLDERHFDTVLDRPLATLRLFRYPAAWGSPATTTPPRPDAGVHTDGGHLTVVAAGDVGRLQVRGGDGRWIEVPAMKDAFVCNVGDALMRRTGGRYVSTPHRVLPPQHERHSIVFFLDADPQAVAAAPGRRPSGVERVATV